MNLPINLLGFDPESAFLLLKKSAEKFAVSFEAHSHIGGWTEILTQDSAVDSAKDFAKAAIENFYPKAFLGEPFAFAIAKLRERGEKITCAESCTGGLLAAFFTAIGGASEVFDGSLVTYSNRLKTEWLKVGVDTLENYGAVSEECVLEMANGARKLTGADYALSVSGIAGPGGGTANKPVGTVFISIADRNGVIAEHLRLSGTRREIQKAAVYNALRLLLMRL